ncbi:hypothetical protein VUR80DRAFT_117 [Thermomyces stellatus]
MATFEDDASETRPLLAGDDLPAPYTPTKSPTTTDEEAGSTTSLPPSRSPDAYIQQEHSPLGRDVSWTSAYIIIISRVIGSGIFATPGTILRAVGSPGLALCLWILGALIAGCGLMVSLEFGCMLPRSGGTKVYLEFTYRHPRFLSSTMVATHIVLLGFSASNCVVFSRYVLFALGPDAPPSDVLKKTVAVGLLSSVTVIHGYLPRFGIRMQNWLGYIKVGMVVFMVLSGLYVVALPPASDSGIRAGQPLPSWRGLWEGSVWNIETVAVAFFQVSYSYAGLDNVNNILNEVKDPVRTLPSVASTALLTAGFLYTLINIAYFMVVPIQEIKDSGEMIAALFFERLFGEHLGRIALPLAIALSAAGNVMVVVIAQSRLKQEIARQGLLPFSDVLASTRPFGSPLGGLLVHYIPSFLVIVCPPSEQVYSFILSVEGYPGQFFSLAVGAGLIWLRFKRSDLHRPFKAWIPAVVLVLCLNLSLLAAPFFSKGEFPTYAAVGITIDITEVPFTVVTIATAATQLPTSTFGTTPSIPEANVAESDIPKGTMDVHTELNYYKDPEDGSPPYATYVDRPETFERPVETHPAKIHDVRGRESEYTLDKDGFEFVRRPAAEKEFLDEDAIKAGYYDETEQLLKDVTGASKIFIFDHTIRRQAPGAEASGTRNLRGPVQHVHIDQSYSASLSRVTHHFPEEADTLLKGRVQIINVWRPIKTVLRDPLAVAQAGSVPDSDLVPIPLIYPTRKGETYSVRYNESHRWFYKSGLEPDEALLIKMHLILTGATGLVGSAVLDAIIKTKDVSKISILSRRPVKMPEDAKDPRINVILHKDFEKYDSELLRKLEGANGVVWARGINQSAVETE